MTPSSPPKTASRPADWRDIFALTKPRVISLVVFTGLCGLIAAPDRIHPVLGLYRDPVHRGGCRRRGRAQPVVGGRS